MADDDDPAQLDADGANQPMEVEETVINNMEDDCFCQSARCRQLALSTALDQILDPGLVFASRHLPDKIWPILSSGACTPDPAAYLKELSEYRIESHCALAWPTGCIAYRCRTCSGLPSMSICTECFRAGDHQGHDYNMFKSRCGGACDCGYDIMKASGHCSNHGVNAKAPKSNEPIPANLTCVPTRAMPRMLSRLVISLRRHAVGQTVETDVYLDCLMGIVNSSAILKDIMIQALLSEEAYSSQARLLINHPDSRASKIVRETLKILKRERKRLVAFKIPSNWPGASRAITAFCDKPPHKTFLEELVFWMIAHEFNQKLVCFLLGFLMDKSYKNAFSRLFVNYYPNIAMCLASSSTDPRRNQQDSFEQLSPRILQITVQMYNDSDLAEMLCEEEMTLHTLIYCIRIMIEGSQSDGIFSALKTNPLCKHDSNAPKVVCCDNMLLRDRLLSSFTEDLITILNLDHEAKRLLSDKNLLQIWLEFVSYFQTMSPHKRELNEHAPYETGPRQSVFMIESEFCLVPLWTILNHLSDSESISFSRQLLESIHENLASWLYRMSIGPHSKLDTYFMSFHIPLHRMMAATIRHLIYELKVPEDQIFNWLSKNQLVFGSKFSYRSAQGARVAIKIDDFIKMLLLHPLQALNLYHQTRSGMWTRNGILTVNQAITYVHCAYCHSIIDMDMFFLRYFSSKLKPDTFLKSLLQRFYAWHCLSFTCGPIFSDTTMDALRVHYYFNIQPEQITQMVESCLVTLIQLLTLDNHCNISSREQTKQEMICLISVAHRSYSYLLDMLPVVSDHQRNEEMLDSLLEELTVYKPASHGTGGNLQQGYYTLKSEIWENDYNPIQVLYRYYQRRDYQQSLDRFFQHAKSTGKLNRRSHSSALWPPLKVPHKIADFGPIDLGALVRCQTLLGTIFSILYKSIYVEEIPDSMMAYTIHLLELALRKQLQCISDAKNEMEHDQRDCKEFENNPSFVGKYSYRELISYYENMPKDEAMLRGRTIYSLFAEGTSQAEPHSNVKLFPFVKHALDLSFDTTWFPFCSVIKNCLVLIETVHSLPRDEFDAMIQCTNSEKTGNESASDESLYTALSSDRASEQSFPDMSTTSSTRSTESQTGVWSNLIGLEVEEVDDIVIEVDAYDEEDGDEMIEIDDLNGDEDETIYVEDSSELESSILSHHLSASNAPSPLASSTGASASRPSEASTSTTSAPTATASSSATASDRDASSANEPNGWPPTIVSLYMPDSEPDPTGRQDINIEGYIRLRDYMDRLGAQNLASQPNLSSDNSVTTGSAAIHNDGVVQFEAPALDETENNLARQGQTSRTLPAQSNEISSHSRLTWTPFQQQQPQQPRTELPQQQPPPAQPQNLITERRAILDSPPRHMITNSPQPLALEGVAASTLTLSRATVVVNTNESSNDMPNQERQLFGRSLRPPVGLSAFNQNVTRSLGECTANDLTELRQRQTTNQIEGSLSEIDIQARFTGFFSSDTSSPASTSASSRVNTNRIIRPRQMARRGNYRGAYLTEPYLLYNNLNTNNNNNNNTNNNNNNGESVQELVRRSVAVVPAITDAIRSTIQQRVENLATARGATATTAPPLSGNGNRAAARTSEAPREPPSESPRSSSNSPPPNPLAASDHLRSRPFYLRDPISLVPDGYRPANRFITTRRSTQQQIPTDQRTRRLRKEHRQHHGESILTLLLRLHAKYSHRPRSYHYDELRARTNLDPKKRCRIGDGSHFLTIVLDLICVSNVQHRERVEYLTELIWPRQSNERTVERDAANVGGLDDYDEEKATAVRGDVAYRNDVEIESKTKRVGGKSSCCTPDADTVRPAPAAAFGLNLSNTVKSEPTTKPSNLLAFLTPEEKRLRAKERQTRLMAEFASKQRAFMAKYAANISEASSSTAAVAAVASTGCANLGRSGPSSDSSGASTSTTAYRLQKYSDQTMQTGDKMSMAGDPDSAEHYEEQPINLSSKSNQGQASRLQSTFDADNNEQTAQRSVNEQPRAGACDEAQMSSTATISDKNVSTKTASTTSNEHSAAEREALRYQQSVPEDTKYLPGSSFYDPGTSHKASGDDQVDDDPYECCICGLGTLDNSTLNPLGLVVLLQSTSVYGHSHLRPRSERKLPCDELEHSKLKEETYAKYLERRIDILSDHFTKSSWLDAINIGAEGGVHVQSCGHHLHIECHQSYIRSLDQEDGMRVRNESDEFQCPVCRQLANSVLPILNDDFHSGTNRTETSQAFPTVTSKLSPAKETTKITPLTGQHNDNLGCQHSNQSSWDTNHCGCSGGCSRSQTPDSVALMPSVSFDDQIAQVSLLLRDRRAPNQRELQSSAAFCSHLTKATGPQYRLIRTGPSMHSLFLFLSSIARTNIEAGLIIRQITTPSSGLLSGSTLPGTGQLNQQHSPSCPAGPTTNEPTMDKDKGKHTCFQLLFRVLALNARTLMNDQWCSYEHIWSRLTHHVPEADRLGIRPHNSEVPLLLMDPVAMLLQFMFTISGSKFHKRELFTCLVKVIFNLTVIQSAALVLSYVKSVPELRDEFMQSPYQSTQVSSEQNCSEVPPSQIDRSQNPIINQRQEQQAAGKGVQPPHNTKDVRSYRQTIQLESLLWVLWTNLGALLTKNNEEPLMNSVVRDSWNRLAGNYEDRFWAHDDLEQCSQWTGSSQEADKEFKLRYIENKIKLACLPFLRAAAYLQQHLFGHPNPKLRCEIDEASLTNLCHIEDDFSDLIRCLGLRSTIPLTPSRQRAATNKGDKLRTDAHIALHQCLNWPSSGTRLVASWALELLQLAQQYSIAARTLLLSRPLTWHRPALMQLPHSFDDIFMFYYRRKCSLCQQVPKDVAVCLVCGAPICFRASCCKDRSRSRQVHSQHCGANTAVFLAVHTSGVVVIRGNRACVWGSVYLDAHDEEDNGLQRGKPLYMVPARFALLEQQWLTHAFDHTCGKRWIYLQEAQ